MSDDQPERRPHDLFLPEKEDDEILTEQDIGLISIVRTAPHQENAGQTYTPQEMVSTGSIFRTFGGGTYAVTARDRHGRVLKTGRRVYTFRGPSYPMDGSGPPQETPITPAVPPPSTMQQQQPAAPSIDLSPIAEAMKAMAQSADSNTRLLIELMKGQQSFTHEIVKTMAEARSSTTSSGNDVDTLIKGMELGAAQIENVMNARDAAMEAAKASGAGNGGESITETLQAVTGAVGAFAEMRKGGGGGKGTPVTQKRLKETGT